MTQVQKFTYSIFKDNKLVMTGPSNYKLIDLNGKEINIYLPIRLINFLINNLFIIETYNNLYEKIDDKLLSVESHYSYYDKPFENINIPKDIFNEIKVISREFKLNKLI